MDKSTWEKNVACLESIFHQLGQSDIEADTKHPTLLKVYPSYFEVKSRPIIDASPSGGTRGEIVSFSRKSRSRMMKAISAALIDLDWFQTFTFADDTMQGLTITERSEFASRCLDRFQVKVKRKYPELKGKGFWRREWEPRKSGILAGQECPHFHFLFDFKAFDRDGYRSVALDLAQTWVGITGTADEKALSVATHETSFSYLENQSMATRYVSKYMAKDENRPPGARGRFWGGFGKVDAALPVVVRITLQDEIKLRRLARKKAKKKNKKGKYNKKFLEHLKHRNSAYWLFLDSGELARFFSWQYSESSKEAIEIEWRMIA